MTQRLVAKEVARLCVERFAELGAVVGKTSCRYTYPDGSHCAIGIALAPRVAAAEEIQSCSVRDLARQNYIDPDDLQTLLAIQMAHDRLALTNSSARIASGAPPITWGTLLRWIDLAAVRPALLFWIEKRRDHLIDRESVLEFYKFLAEI
jgi:hypothetical protein